MFATLVGPYPRAPHPGRPDRLRDARAGAAAAGGDPAEIVAAEDALVCEVLAEQVEAGLDLLTDGQVRGDDPMCVIARGLQGFTTAATAGPATEGPLHHRPRAASVPEWVGPITVAAWQFAAAAAASLVPDGAPAPLVRACIVGPYTLARLSDPGDVGKERLVLGLAEALNAEMRALAAAGAPVIQVDESALTLVRADDEPEWELVREMLRRLTTGLDGRHLMLAITGGSADRAASRVLYDAPFSSYLFDLILGPDNWYPIADAPPERGIVCGVADARTGRRDDEPVMAWAAHYAASMRGRGLDRVGLAPSAGLERLPRDAAAAKIRGLGAAARTAAISDVDALGAAIDPRATDARSAALGRYEPARDRPHRPRG